MNKYNKEILKGFFTTAFCFLCAMLVIKIFDFLTFESFLRAATHCLVTSGIIVLIIFVIHSLSRLISNKFADWISSVLFGIIVFGEIGLTIYTHESGQLMGKELFIRPFSEMMQTVLAAMSIFSVIIITLAIIGGFVLLTYFARKRWQKRWMSLSVIALMTISILSILFIDNILDDSGKLEERNNETSKMWFMTISSLSADDEPDNTNITYNEQLVDDFLAENPNYLIPDKEYPLERADNTPDVLGHYFRESDKKPDIVLIIVESLGNEMMGTGFSPYIDSLAKHSLYWKNCLSTTTRSYGAVPAITASVVGPKGFQFGVMPEHNSLFNILKTNGYRTNAFYGGDFSFDCISEYLIAQDIDYMSDFYNEYKSGDKDLGGWWGYFDHVMFSRSIDEIKKMESPMFNVLITITNHEALNIRDERKKSEYIHKADMVLNSMEPKDAETYGKNKMRFCSMLYTDDCIRDFINKYKQLPSFDNTIFIITGDHSSGLIVNNRLSYFRVPLIIWSPMLDKNGTFNSIVTHNDVAPSVNALLRDKYQLDTPEYVHWISDGLDTSNAMHFDKKMIHVNYNREMREMVYNKYFYWTKTQWYNEGVAEINENIDITPINDDALMAQMNQKLELYKYIIRYTYYNNKLTKHPIVKATNYQISNELHEKSKIKCTTPNKKPSVVGVRTFNLFDDIKIDDNVQKIKVSLNAEVFINDSLWQDEYMDLVFQLNDMKYTDKFSKFVKSDILRKGKWYDLSVSKEFIAKESDELILSVYISSVKYDDQWVGGSAITIGDRHLKVEVAKP